MLKLEHLYEEFDIDDTPGTAFQIAGADGGFQAVPHFPDLVGVFASTISLRPSNTAPPGAPALPVNYVGPYGETRTNLRFQGFAKTWESELGESEPTFTIEAQDTSMLLHNQQVPPRAGIPVNMPFDQAIAQYLAQNFVQFVGLACSSACRQPIKPRRCRTCWPSMCTCRATGCARRAARPAPRRPACGTS